MLRATASDMSNNNDNINCYKRCLNYHNTTHAKYDYIAPTTDNDTTDAKAGKQASSNQTRQDKTRQHTKDYNYYYKYRSYYQITKISSNILTQ